MSESLAPRLPAYDELPRAAHGGRSAWGLFGQEDSVGLLNLQTTDRVEAAARLIRSGEVYSLNAPTNVPEPPLFRRGAVRHSLITNDGRAFFDDKLDNYYPQGVESVGLARARRLRRRPVLQRGHGRGRHRPGAQHDRSLGRARDRGPGGAHRH